MLIYHIVLPEVWAAFDTGLYRHASLDSEGFIHCSFADQLDGVIERYYSKEDEVVVLEIESDRLMSRMIKEPSTNSEIYPHVYGPINRDAIVAETKRNLAADKRG
ncbi:MAG: DUF952 domain-containing protein [Pyrinomonadaceae bacterium]